MDMKARYDSGNQLRAYLLKTVGGLSNEQLLAVPPGLKNNILWNLGHIAWAQGVFAWELCGKAPPVPKSYHDLFKNDTSPADWKETPGAEEVKSVLAELNQRQLEAETSGQLANRKPFSLGSLLIETNDDAMLFNLWHEGIHLGMIMSIKRLVA